MKKNNLLILILLIALISMACSCSLFSLPDLERLKGSGTMITEEREINNATEVQIDGSGTLHFVQGDVVSLTIEAEDNIIDRIHTSVVGNRLIIQPDTNWFNLWVATKEIHYYLTLPALDQLEAAGSINVVMDSLTSSDLTISLSGSSNLTASQFETGNLDLSGSGSADIKIDTLAAENLKASFSGSNNFVLGDATTADVEINAGGSINLTINTLEASDVKMNFSGSADSVITELTTPSLDLKMGGSAKIKIENGVVAEQKINISGSGLYLADGVKSKIVHFSGGGSAEGRLWVTQELHINASGSCRISYYGSPTIEQFVAGSSDIVSMGDKE